MTTSEGTQQTKVTEYMPNRSIETLTISTTKRKSRDQDKTELPSPSQQSPDHKKAASEEIEDVSMDAQSAGSPIEETTVEQAEPSTATKIPASPVRTPLKSALRNSLAKIAAKAADLPETPLPSQWVSHRFAVMFEIKMPETKHKRTEYMARELNLLLETIATYHKVYVRKYKEHHKPLNEERSSWIKTFSKDQVSDLTQFTHGFHFFHDLRAGTQRVLIQLILPKDFIVDELVMNVNGHKWASKHGRAFQNIKEQTLYEPKYVGFLFRSNYAMTASPDLQRFLEARAERAGHNIQFGLTFKVIPNSTAKGKEYNKEKAVRAVCISTNAPDTNIAWDLLHKWYNTGDKYYPLIIPMKFIPSKDNPDIANNSVALQNISVLFERQKIFLRDTVTIPCAHLADPTIRTKSGHTIRKVLMDTKVTTGISAYQGGSLFHAITAKTSADGDRIHYFTFHRVVEKEARNVIGGLPQFMETELKEDPELYCHAHLVDNTHAWNSLTRTVKNSTTDYLAELAGEDDISDLEDDDDYSMDTKGYRECKRMLGLEDTETVADIRKRRKPKNPDNANVPTQIDDSQSMVSEMTGMTNYSTASQASKNRKKLRSQVNVQQIELTTKDAEIEALRKKLAMMEKSSGEQNQAEAKEDTVSRTRSVVIELDPTEHSHQDKHRKHPNATSTTESAHNGVSFQEDEDQKGQQNDTQLKDSDDESVRSRENEDHKAQNTDTQLKDSDEESKSNEDESKSSSSAKASKADEDGSSSSSSSSSSEKDSPESEKDASSASSSSSSSDEDTSSSESKGQSSDGNSDKAVETDTTKDARTSTRQSSISAANLKLAEQAIQNEGPFAESDGEDAHV